MVTLFTEVDKYLSKFQYVSNQLLESQWLLTTVRSLNYQLIKNVGDSMGVGKYTYYWLSKFLNRVYIM
jgi:hypothetical protein